MSIAQYGIVRIADEPAEGKAPAEAEGLDESSSSDAKAATKKELKCKKGKTGKHRDAPPEPTGPFTVAVHLAQVGVAGLGHLNRLPAGDIPVPRTYKELDKYLASVAAEDRELDSPE